MVLHSISNRNRRGIQAVLEDEYDAVFVSSTASSVSAKRHKNHRELEQKAAKTTKIFADMISCQHKR
jgi:hypothetical protein